MALSKMRPTTEQTRPLRGDARLPLYERLREALAARVRGGEWTPGEALPSEQTMANSYGVALGTLRRAIGALVDDGLLERRHGSGTYVRQGGNFASSMFRFFRMQGDDGQELRPEGRLLVREVGPPPAAARDALKLSAKSECLRISRLRLVGGEPLLAEDIVLPLKPFRALVDLPAADMGPLLYPLYAEVCGQVIARATETLTFGLCPAPQARLLRRETGSPVVVIERVAFGLDDKPKEWRMSIGPAERLNYHAEIR